ncbi:MAG: DUF3489 domain-containing protein [Alphaproteobacteria bacterium]
MPKLTDTQLIILSAAAARADGLVLPLPDSLKPNKAALTRSINSLLKRDLIEERPTKRGEQVWREEGHQRLTLGVTATGLEAIGVTGDAPDAASTTDTKPASKADGIMGLLKQPGGAGIADIQAATGWQPHSIRAFLSGLRKKGIAVGRTKDEAGKAVYSIAGA